MATCTSTEEHNRPARPTAPEQMLPGFLQEPQLDNITMMMHVVAWIKWLEHYKVDMQQVIRILHQRNGKRNCLLLEGAPSFGKSAFVKLLAGTFSVVHMPVWREQSQFVMSAFCDWATANSLYVIEELIITRVNSEALKMLCEGSDYIRTDTKNGTFRYVEPRSVIWCCNTSPAQTYPRVAVAFNERWYRVQLYSRCPGINYNALYIKNKEMAEAVWKRICVHFSVSSADE